MGDQPNGSGNGVSGSYMKAFLPGLVLGLVIGGFGAAYLVPMLSTPDTKSANPGPRPGSQQPVPADQDRVQERPDQPATGEAQPTDAKPDAKPETNPETNPETKPEAKPETKPADAPK